MCLIKYERLLRALVLVPQVCLEFYSIPKSQFRFRKSYCMGSSEYLVHDWIVVHLSSKIKLLKHIFMFFNRIYSHKSGTVWFNVANKSHEDTFQRQNENSRLYIQNDLKKYVIFQFINCTFAFPIFVSIIHP